MTGVAFRATGSRDLIGSKDDFEQIEIQSRADETFLKAGYSMYSEVFAKYCRLSILANVIRSELKIAWKHSKFSLSRLHCYARVLSGMTAVGDTLYFPLGLLRMLIKMHHS